LIIKVFYSRKEEKLQAQRLKQGGKMEALVMAMRENNLRKGENMKDILLVISITNLSTSEETALQALPNLLKVLLESGLCQGTKVPREGLLYNGPGAGLMGPKVPTS
jgi:hypothetical protein